MTIREHRKNVLRETLHEVSERCGVDIAILSRMERSGRAKYSRIPEIAKGYCLATAAFEAMLGGVNSETKDKRVRNARRVPPRNSPTAAT